MFKDQKKLLMLLVILLSVPVAVFLVQQAVKFFSKAAIAPVDIYFTPSQSEVPPGSVFTLRLNPHNQPIDAVAVEVNFEKDKILFVGYQSGEISPLKNEIIKTGGDKANQDGKIVIVLGRNPNDVAPSSDFVISGLMFNVAANYSGPGVTSMLTIGEAGTQIVDSQARELGFQAQPASIIIKPSSGIGSISLSPSTSDIAVDSVFPVAINFQTGGVSISSLVMRLIFDYSGATPELNVVDASGNLANKVFPNSALSNDWNFSVNSVTRASSKVTIDLAALNTNPSGFSSSTQTNLATMYLKAGSVPATNPVVLTFDMTKTRMLAKNDPTQDILGSASGASYTVKLETNNPASLSFGFKMQGVTGVCTDRDTTLSLVSPSGKYDYELVVTSDSLGVFKSVDGSVLLVGLPVSGSYDVLVKSPGYLRKKLGTLDLVAGVNSAPSSWNDIFMRAGDFDSPGTDGFNILNISDIGKMLSVYDALEVPVTAANRIYDINCDDIISIMDISVVLSNYTALTVTDD